MLPGVARRKIRPSHIGNVMDHLRVNRLELRPIIKKTQGFSTFLECRRCLDDDKVIDFIPQLILPYLEPI